jgi:hypothetical protein
MASGNVSEVLMEIKLKLMDPEECLNLLKPRFPFYNPKAMFCAFKENSGVCNVLTSFVYALAILIQNLFSIFRVIQEA